MSILVIYSICCVVDNCACAFAEMLTCRCVLTKKMISLFKGEHLSVTWYLLKKEICRVSRAFLLKLCSFQYYFEDLARLRIEC